MTATNVLIVDDDADLRELIALHLNAHGYATLEAGDGEAALDVLREPTPISLVLLDLRMPRMNGLEALAELRSNRSMHQPAVVVLTGDRDAGRHAIAGGAQDFLLKPIELDDLFAAVHRYGEAQA